MSSSPRALSTLARAAVARCRSAEATRCISSASSFLTSSTSSSAPPHSFETALAVATCGNGDHGRLGHGGVSSTSYFTLVRGGGLGEFSSSSSLAATRPVAVAAGGAHTLVLTADGAVLSFGLNDAGQLGHSEGAAFVTVPMEALIPEEAVAIAAGDRHSLAVGASGRVWAWGAGAGAGAAPGDDDPSSAPARLPRLVPGIGSAVSVAAGSAHSLILCRDDETGGGTGSVYSWGDGARGALGHAEGSAAASGSGFLSFFSSFPGGGRGRRARGRAAAERAAPRLLRTLAGRDVADVAASGSRSGAVVAGGAAAGSAGSGGGGQVLAWGDDGGVRSAVSGAGRAALDRPAPVPGLESLAVSLLALGRSHALAVREGGSPLLAWGDGSDHGALGLTPPARPPSLLPPPPPPTSVDRPCRVASLDGEVIVSASCGWKHSLACCEVSADGAFGERGGPPSSSSPSSSSSSSSLFSWGWGGSQGSEGPLDPSGTSTGGGQLGTGDDLDRPRPWAVSKLLSPPPPFEESDEREPGGASGRFLTRWRALAVSAGLNHSAALVEVALDELR